MASRAYRSSWVVGGGVAVVGHAAVLVGVLLLGGKAPREIEEDPALLARIRMKPVRSQSGVTVVTVLTKPYPCPGKCVFCPTDWRMP